MEETQGKSELNSNDRTVEHESGQTLGEAQMIPSEILEVTSAGAEQTHEEVLEFVIALKTFSNLKASYSQLIYEDHSRDDSSSHELLEMTPIQFLAMEENRNREQFNYFHTPSY